jgi:hypothetical protein
MSRSESSDRQLLQDSEYNILHQLERKADFLYSAIESYIRHAEKDDRPGLVKLWNKIKDDDDEQNHLKMLRNVLIEETRDNRFFR